MDEDIGIDDEIEIEDIDEDSEDEEEPSQDIDGEEQPSDSQEGFIIEDLDDGGSAPTPYDEDPVPQDERIPVDTPRTKTITVVMSEVISDFSQESLDGYEESGAIAYAVYDDGTKVEVDWSEVTIPTGFVDTVVTEAELLARATNQHFWSRSTDPDSDGAGTGAFVTDEEQDDFLEAAAGGFTDLGDGTNNTKPWHNLLMNSLGILLRTGFNNLVSITRSAISFFDGSGNQAGNIVASFGSGGAQIGKDYESHLELDYHSLKLIDGNNPPNTYFHVSDMRGTDGKALLTETFTANGKNYDLMYLANQVVLVTAGGIEVTYTSSTRLQVTRITLSESPPSGSTVSITYKTEDSNTKAFTFGSRNSSTSIGAMSYAEGSEVKSSGYVSHAEGDRTEASGRVSHAEGSNTVASGDFSHAEGGSTHATGNHSHVEGNQATASGYNSHAEGNQTKAIGGDSHAEGWSSEARGARSHAQNERTIALGASQTVVGRFNSVDQNNEYALIIGNGGEWDDSFTDPDNPSFDYDDEYTHSNALTVDWDGNVICNEVNGLALQSMGEMVEESGTATLASSTNANVVSKQLQPGTWLVNARLQYPSNATGRRAAKLSTTSQDDGNVISSDVRNAVSGGTTQVQTERVFAFDEATTVYLIGWQNSGSALSCSGQIQAVRISPAIGDTYTGGGGGTGGTSDYSDLTNKPAINGVTLSGDKSFSQLGMDFASAPSSGGNADKANAILYGNVDSTSTATAFTATVAGLTQLVDGTCVMLHNGIVTSASGFTVNVNGLGAKKCYNNMTNATQDTTIFNVAYTMIFVYSTSLDNGNGGWWIYRGYDGNTNTIGYQIRTNSTVMKTAIRSRYYRIFFTSADGTHWEPANTGYDNSATSAKTVNTRPINPFGRIVYTSANTNYVAEADVAATTIWDQYALNLGYSFNRTGAALTLTSKLPVYVKCAPQADGSAIIDSTEPIVQALPTTADGKIYIYLGVAYSATNIELFADHPVYCFSNGALRKWTGQAVQAALTAGDHITIENNTISVDELTAAQTAALLT